MELIYTVKNNDLTINQILKNKLYFSSRLLSKLIRKNLIFRNGEICDSRETPTIGDILKIDFNYSEDNSNIIPTKMDLDIIFEDEWFLIINKPAGIAIHPSSLHYSNSICNGVRFYFDSINLKKKIRPVNRLDLNTSGLVVFAKCEYIQECLSLQIKKNILKKEYLALCTNDFKIKKDTINLPIARKSNSIIERCISNSGQDSITHYKVLMEFNNYNLVKCILETGRTHQIRVHMSAIGHSLLGDSLYGTSSNLITRQALHCYKIYFSHPIYNNFLQLYAKIPLDFKKLIKE